MLRTLIALAGPNGFIGMQDLPPAIRQGQQALAKAEVSAIPSKSNASMAAHGSATLAGITEQAIRVAIDAAGGNIAAAARRLGISRSTLYRHMS